MNAIPKALPATQQRTWVEDIEIKVDGQNTYVSLEVDHSKDQDGNIVVKTVLYDGKPITALPALVDLIERVLEADE